MRFYSVVPFIWMGMAYVVQSVNQIFYRQASLQTFEIIMLM